MRRPSRYFAKQATGRDDWLVFRHSLIPGEPPKRVRFQRDLEAVDGRRVQRADKMNRTLAEARAAALNRQDRAGEAPLP